jgi:hypothetical protein
MVQKVAGMRCMWRPGNGRVDIVKTLVEHDMDVRERETGGEEIICMRRRFMATRSV